MSLPRCSIPSNRRTNVLLGVYHPSRLKILQKCLVISGVVKKVRREKDKDYHIDVLPDPQFQKYLVAHQKYLVAEIIPLDQPAILPQIGAKGVFMGAWVYDTIHGWNQVHPCWKIVTSRPMTKLQVAALDVALKHRLAYAKTRRKRRGGHGSKKVSPTGSETLLLPSLSVSDGPSSSPTTSTSQASSAPAQPS